MRSVVILAAGRPFRGVLPSILEILPDRRRLFDWLKDSFYEIPCDFSIVAGYRIEDVASELDEAHISFEPAWGEKGVVGSLLKGLPLQGPCYVTYADILFRSAAVRDVDAMRTLADISIAVDTQWRRRFEGRSERDISTAEKVILNGHAVRQIGSGIPIAEASGEFIGLAHLSAAAVEQIHSLAEREPHCGTWPLPKLFDRLISSGLTLCAIDVDGDWASLDEPQDLARFVHGSKAQTLSRLSRIVRESTIPPLFTVRFDQWQSDQAAVIEELSHAFPEKAVAVRSSSLREDGWAASMAGSYATHLNVAIANQRILAVTIESVFRSYASPCDADQVLVQAMVTEVEASGVVLSRTLQRGAPYYQINFDRDATRSDRITSGKETSGELITCHHSALDAVPEMEPTLQSLPNAVRELTEVLGHDNLDIEFAISADRGFNLLQVRPIAAHSGDWRGNDQDIELALTSAERLFSSWQQPVAAVRGDRTVFSVMTDWNPAEIIGIRPRQLAFDLYRYLVTDSVWSLQRAQFGYRDVAPVPLMVLFAGHAFVDVRSSLNSFLPSSVPDKVAEQLVEAQIEALVRAPDLHDKVEFAVASTGIDFGFSARRGAMRLAGIDDRGLDVWAAGLADITRAAINPARLDELDGALRKLEIRRQGFRSAQPLQAAIGLLRDCRSFGTLPFAHYARHAFIAKAILQTAGDSGITGPAADQRFVATLFTVAQSVATDSHAIVSGAMTRDDFLIRHGHLRPGTYDITVPSYREAPELYLAATGDAPSAITAEGLSESEIASLSRALSSLALPDDMDRVLSWMRRAIEGRERAKHIFTRNVSDALELIASFGEGLGLDRDTLSFIGLSDLETIALGGGPATSAAWIRERAEQNRAAHKNALRIELPPVLTTTRDFRCFRQMDSHPTFLGTHQVMAATVVPEGGRVDITGKIVLLRSADPGYDWIFACAPAGLVTAYGGANSHMTIRAAEMNLPAAIGVGEPRFDRLCAAQLLLLDSVGHRLDILR